MTVEHEFVVGQIVRYSKDGIAGILPGVDLSSEFLVIEVRNNTRVEDLSAVGHRQSVKLARLQPREGYTSGALLEPVKK